MTQPRKNFVGENFERATNTRELGLLGDPERWGWTQTMVFTFPANANVTQVKTSRQLVRVQVPQLAARKWGLIATWEFFSDDVLVTLAGINADLVIGAGQSSFGVPAQVFPVPNVQTPLTLAAGATGGATDLGEVTAVSINGRLRVSVRDAGAANPTTVRAIVGLAASPRAL